MALEQMGFEIEASHHECAQGQHEIDFKYAEALHAADNIMTFKLGYRGTGILHPCERVPGAFRLLYLRRVLDLRQGAQGVVDGNPQPLHEVVSHETERPRDP